ncbi:hypothetical protein KAFR_0I02290 [Kazachstania africana CBS 2517]|uniref:Uncharacterized protein n=1 Tax=Kazachstania africana (strain ATCC 22294 / BCRC 22015 / CBS 2517 / CECT 1963 / NBRC 1671 / NRRL Y-8276) TaxID=1071382 RepID=H2B058_KAZAF|nr:hypothetical protein KAFR_0I02290 [Kazachstania africana CBS 2517]CCF60008.1 hypothetical protein KAFR_0I02290 [Kazachstania africana CBS 2517]
MFEDCLGLDERESVSEMSTWGVFTMLLHWCKTYTVDMAAYLVVNVLFVPLNIATDLFFRLCLLPFNLILKVFLLDSHADLTRIFKNQLSLWNNYIIILTTIQYLLVVLIFTLVMGIMTGSFLSLCHALFRIPNIYIHINLNLFKWLNIKQSSKTSPSADDIDDQVSDKSPSATPLAYRFPHRHTNTGSATKNEIMQIASKLPSDFFNREDINQDFTGYQTPLHSRSNSISMSDSSMTMLFNDDSMNANTLRTSETTVINRKPILKKG